MSNQIEITFSVEDAQAFKAWQRQQAAAAKMKKELDGLKNSGNQSGQVLANAAGQAGKTALAAVAALTGIGGVISAIQMVAEQLKREVANIRAVQSQSGNTQADLGDKLLGMIRKFGGSMTPMQLRTEVLQIAERTGQDPGKVARTAENAAAAAGPQTQEEAKATLSAAEAVIRFYPELMEDEAGIVGKSLLDLMNRFKMDAQTALGFMQELDQAHHSTGALDLAKHGVPTVSAVAAFGGSAEESAGLAAAMSQGMMDEGAESGTVSEKLAAQLRERLPEGRTGLKTTKERIDYLRARPDEARAYAEGGTIAGVKHNPADFGRSGGRTYVEGLLGINPETAYMYDKYVSITKEMGNRESQRRAHDTGLEATESLPEVAAGNARRRLKAGSTGVQIANMSGGLAGIAREGLQQILKDAGLSDIDQQAALAKFEWNSALGKNKPIQEVVRQLRQVAEDAENPLVPQTNMPIGIGASGGPVTTYKRDPSKATDEDRVKALRLRATADALEAEAQVAEARQREAIKTDAQSVAIPRGVQVALDEAKAAATAIQNDTNVTPEEREFARGKMRAATDAVRGTEGMSDETARNLMGAIFKLIQVVENNSKSTEDNTKANGGKSGSQAPSGPTAAKGPVRNGQASRMLDRRSQYQSPRQFT